MGPGLLRKELSLISRKRAHKHVLQKLSERIARVRDFLSLFKPGIFYDIVPISDVYGPTAWDANIQALVVRKETLSGAESIHNHRPTHNLTALRTFVIDMVSPTSRLEHGDLELLKATRDKREEEDTEEDASGAVTCGVVPSS
ncbi:hypothetical protein BDN72DRAFT_385093 [Pluteus cervinus]|uniref:Uncharacterized protein n=1 Tax=Pluteus cervinus TaxID=181527 RepID=A0ACD3AAH6_9AGAR|nr:hypothetical protein BDN72DRAFT_385093 [Pluteus cervinus]